MTDVLKLAEEALELVRGEVEHPMTTQSQESYVDALAALRAARAEWGWEELSACSEVALRPGDQVGCYDSAGWSTHTVKQQMIVGWFIACGWTHFYRPQLPPPPAREEVGNG